MPFFKIESNSILKVCPKLTKNHFDLNNVSKMKVKYAAQVIIILNMKCIQIIYLNG